MREVLIVAAIVLLAMAAIPYWRLRASRRRLLAGFEERLRRDLEWVTFHRGRR